MAKQAVQITWSSNAKWHKAIVKKLPVPVEKRRGTFVSVHEDDDTFVPHGPVSPGAVLFNESGVYVGVARSRAELVAAN